MTSMLTTDKKSCSILSDLLSAHGVCDVVISPGSRNTPLILALDANDAIEKRVVIDERSAAFIALGISISKNRPVAVVCTSGTALLNYSPAVAEAYYQGIPLIVISADRPMQWIDQDDSQTIRQFEALGNFVKKSYDIPDFNPDDEEMAWYANRIINDALITASDRRKGPVHINIQLNQPLSNRIEINQSHQRVINSITTTESIANDSFHRLIKGFENSKILIVGGFHSPCDKLSESLNNLASLPNVAVLTETLSNVKGEKILSTIDRIIAPLSKHEISALTPDIAITFGGALVSRYIKQFLRQHPPQRHLSIGHNHTTVDCFKSLTERIEINPDNFFKMLFEEMKDRRIESDYNNAWHRHEKFADESHDTFINRIGWSDLKAFSIITNALKKTRPYNIALSNGTPVRYIQLFKDLPYNSCFCNRGVSGIDGCTSTAIGLSVGFNNFTESSDFLLITGDMSFSYDIGALATQFIPDNFKIIVINNSGGGIFRFIPTTANLPQVERYFTVKPVLPLRELADAYRFFYAKAENEDELTETIEAFLLSKDKAILEIVTPPEVSGEILRQYMQRK